VQVIRDRAAAIAAECGVPDDELYAVRLGVTEVVTNAIVHGYGRAVDGNEIRLEVFHEDGELLIVIADDGPGVAPRIASPGVGLGLPVVAAVALRVELRSPAGGGTEAHMVFPCPGGG
jgi:anti-sigma regulatory factor (Ser/Thr protein kinase)